MNRTVAFLLSAVLGAAVCAQNKVADPMPDENKVVDNTFDSLLIAQTARPVPGSTRKGDNPVLFLIGNSTMRTGTLGNGDNGQWGWGYYMGGFFDTDRITVENQALGGMSSRTFYNRLWPDILKGIRKGDWVIIELGHNDNGPYDSGRARASIPGIGSETLDVTIKETGERETVLTYGEYMRRFVREVKAKGANPILFSLTPRNAWNDGRIVRVDKTFGLWARQIADEEQIPFVDLNDITACKYERFGTEKVNTMFYLDKIHTSEFGAKVNAESAVEGLRSIEGLALASYLLPEQVDSLTGSSRRPGCPVVFTIGDSTVKNEDGGDDGMWGWGSVLSELFDTARVTVENHAMAGRSARTFLDEGRWDKVYRSLQPGDFVLMQFGHNDGGDINTGKARGELHGAGPESRVFKMEATGKNKVVYTYGWYLRKFIMDAKEKGAVPVVLSHTPRNKWTDGRIESNASSFGLWAHQAAMQAGAYYIDLNAISGRKLQALGEGNTSEYFKNDHTHSSKAGARLNAASIAEGLRGLDMPLKNYLLPVKYRFDMKNVPVYNEFDGYGLDFGTDWNAVGGGARLFSVRVPDGNYRVTLLLGDKKRKGATTVRAESRRLMLENVATDKGEFVERSFIVNKRTPAITLADSVRINPREVGTMTWDDKLTLEFTGPAPAVAEVTVEPVGDVTTVFLCGNSTVVDQTYEPWTSWGQIIPRYFNDGIVVANHAESGESAESFLAKRRFEKILSTAKPGDWIFFEFGHNDQKEKGPGKGAYYNFATNLKIFIDRSRQAGLNPVLVTPTARRSFDEYGRIRATHGDYPDAMREVARREGVPLIDLNSMTRTLYESMGVEGSRKAFVHYPAGTFPNQSEALADNTHFSPFGATEVAKCVMSGIKSELPELASELIDVPDFDPAHPDDFNSVVWPQAPFVEFEKPYGN